MANGSGTYEQSGNCGCRKMFLRNWLNEEEWMRYNSTKNRNWHWTIKKQIILLCILAKCAYGLLTKSVWWKNLTYTFQMLKTKVKKNCRRKICEKRNFLKNINLITIFIIKNLNIYSIYLIIFHMTLYVYTYLI